MASLPAVLAVDDEPLVLEGLVLHLRRRFEVVTATSGASGLEALAARGPFAVVVSDMRMPAMDGAAFLSRARERWPDTVRVLLTGQADLAAAIAVINQGQVFRFLTKPCAPADLLEALEAAAAQHRLVTAERVLLEQTLHGSISTLTNLLALASPTAFGRASRVKSHVSDLAAELGMPDRWQVEVAAMLSQIGCVTLPTAVADKLYHGVELDRDEQAMAERLPAVAVDLLARIPRLEPVCEILRRQDAPPGRAPRGACLLRAALDYDRLEARGMAADVVLETMHGRADTYDPAVLAALTRIRGSAGALAREVREVRLKDLLPGMTFLEDVASRSGSLLVARGQEVTSGLLERLRNFALGVGVREPIRVVVPPPAGVAIKRRPGAAEKPVEAPRSEVA